MSSSELSDISSSLSSDEGIASVPIPKGKLDHYFKQGLSATPTSPPAKKKRPPSPAHEYVLADNPDIAFLCMFRSRFSDAFPKSFPHYGPQDIERGVIDPIPGDQVERLLCALLGLVLNRKKDIEKGHYTRALEEAIQTHNSQWPRVWNGKNPLHGGGSFNKMSPEERLTLLKALAIWSLESSEAVKAIIKESYKQSRHDDDLNQPLSVQAWGRDGDKRRFWLIEGQDDTHFRLYRESNPALKNNTWRSVAGTIDEVKEVAQRLDEENTQASRRLRDRINAAVPRFEASEEKRRRRDYRLARKAQFVRPEPGFSLYEGRTRGKRPRYTYSDEEDEGSDALSTRRSNRQSGISTPAESHGPTFTASGRQVRSRHGGAYGEIMLSGQQDTTGHSRIGDLDGAEHDDDEDEPVNRGLPRRAARQNRVKTKPLSGKHTEVNDSLGSMDDESDATSSGNEWDGGDEDEPDDHVDDDEEDEDVDMSDNSGAEEDGDDPRQSLVVSLRYIKSRPSPPSQDTPKVAAISKDHSIAQMTSGNSKGSSETAYSTDDLTKPLQDAPKSTQDAAHTQYSRSTAAA
ncbi:hypothetical protein HO173_000443 [Letharia columbiana]|uniref:WHIM1 domain-containing protein n=1 Tax=Letharia columbiana TaxID=112416 RepID=A0A8H6G746_9LECA|nr:uncharacterized protein HO173_000443 [Letharia columbiana]KAF6241731.1 hypothetical protein HO173_000443 [Letharia columbiana]